MVMEMTNQDLSTIPTETGWLKKTDSSSEGGNFGGRGLSRSDAPRRGSDPTGHDARRGAKVGRKCDKT